VQGFSTWVGVSTRSYVGGTGGLGYAGALSAKVELVAFVSQLYERASIDG
jgi:hypothetical protein